MSFSQEVKNEILRRKISKPCCNMAAAYAVACFGKYFDDRGVVLQTENEGVAILPKSSTVAAVCKALLSARNAPQARCMSSA